jgi:hypothetical protein
MNKKGILIPAVLILCFSYRNASAQNDSSWLDLGVLKLKRGLTQTISIKGEELEKMPFASLSEAINVWLYGIYSNDLSLLYVVDGNLLSDANLYSIYDIDEMIFVQNALIQINGAFGQSQLLLIRTKKNRDSKWGISLAGQSNLVNRDLSRIDSGKNYHSNTNWYHHYYAGASRSFNTMELGFSADYLRDVMPSVRSDTIHTHTPFNLTRFRLNAFLGWKLGKKNEIYVSLNYTPQKIDSTQYYTNPYSAFNASTNQYLKAFTPFARWQAEFLPSLKNGLSMAYLSLTGNLNSISKDTNTQFSLVGSTPYATASVGNDQTRHVLIRDRLAYTLRAGDWNFEPSINASYEHLSYQFSEASSTDMDLGPYGISYSSSYQSSMGKADIYFLTPSVNLYYKESFGFQTGLLDNLSPSYGVKIKKVFPFFNLSLDLIRLWHPQSGSSLKIYGSYAQSCLLTLNDYQINDLSGVRNNSDLSLQFIGPGSPVFPGEPTIYGSNAFMAVSAPISDYWTWEAGAGLSLMKGRLQINENFERRKYQGETTGGLTAYGNNYSNFYTTFPYLNSTSNYLGIQWIPMKKKEWEWKTSLNTTVIYTHIQTMPFPYSSVQNAVGDFSNNGSFSWTGGWVNRFRIGNFSAGLDLLYHFNETVYNQNGDPVKINSLLLQNLYLGYLLPANKWGSLELFLNSRNIFQNTKSDLTDARRYYGIGGKIGI